MTATEFRAACAIAFDRDTDLSNVDDSPLHGCALPGFRPALVTVEQCAKLIRCQCAYIFRPRNMPKAAAMDYDPEALAECRTILVTMRRAQILNSAESDRKIIATVTRRLLSA